MSPKIVDLEQLIIAWAWKIFLVACKDVKFKFEDIKFHVNWDRVRFIAGTPVYTDEKRLDLPQSQVIFKSIYENQTKQVQEHTFHTDRCTSCSVNTNITKGYTKGIRLELKLGLPQEIMAVTAGFGREVTMETTDSFTHENSLSWSVNSTIKVPPFHRTIAELVIKEQEYTATFKISTRIRGRVAVVLTNQKDNAFIRCIEQDVHEIMNTYLEKYGKHFSIDAKTQTVTWEVIGNCQFRFGIEQYVQLYENPLPNENFS